MSHAAAAPATDLVPAGLEQRFLAFAIDRVVSWGVAAGAAVLVWRLLVPDHAWIAVGVFAGLVVLFGIVAAVVLGATGTSVGKSTFGLRVVRRSDARPIGVGAALLRTIVVGLGGLPTVGLGDATLALTAVADPERDRRAFHDRYGEAIVVDVRPRPLAADPASEPAPRRIVNLTAMRLLPDPEPVAVQPAPTPTPTPVRTSVPVPSPSRPPAAAPVPGHAPTPGPVPTPVPTPAPAPTSAPTPSPRHAGQSSTPPPPRPPTPPAPKGIWRVTFDTGETFAVEGLAIVGRNPEPRAGEDVRHTVALKSADMSLSKTHAQFQVAADGALVVMDRGSTNGSIVVRRGHSRPLNAGRPSTLLAGDVVRFGDRSMRVERES